MPRRFAWFRRVLKHHDEEESELFPASWEMTRLLVSSFAEYTRADLANVLGKQTPQVGVLFDALQATKDFESSLERRFSMPVSRIGDMVCLCPDQAVRASGTEHGYPRVCQFRWQDHLVHL